MADQPAPKPPSAPPIGFAVATVRHMVKATVCGRASKKHEMTTDWDAVNCPQCLEQAPYRRKRAG